MTPKPAEMLRIWSPPPGDLRDTLAWVSRLLRDLLSDWRCLPAAVMRMRRRQKKGRGPARPRRAGGDGGRHGQAPPFPACREALGKDADNPVTTQETGGPGENVGGSPQEPCHGEEGARRGGVRGEGATARLEMEEHLEKVGDGQKLPLESLSQAWQEGESRGNGEKPGRGPLPCGEEATSCPPGDGTLACPVTDNHPVLSLFYRPEEEEDDDGDWLSEEEGGDAGGRSGADWTDAELALEGEGWREADAALRLAPAPGRPTRPRPEDQAFRVSFYLPGPALQAEDVGDPWTPPEKPWPMRPGPPRRIHCCELGSRGVEEPSQGETKDSQGNWTAKKVRFSAVVTVHPLLVWPFASRAARRGPWEELARDRSRFRRRIEQLEPILGPCLEPGHRAWAQRKIQEAGPESLGGGQGRQDTPLPPSSARMEDPGGRDGRLG